MEADGQDRSREAKRRDRNRREYERSKSEQDRLLLRLDRGDLATLDAASASAGLSRAAFARMFLAPTLGAVAARLAEIDRARAERRQSLAQFLAAAIESALSEDRSRLGPATSAAATEFDALFGSSEEGA